LDDEGTVDGQEPREGLNQAVSEDGRYWARTSDPQLVEPAELLLSVSGNSLVLACLQDCSHSFRRGLCACSRPSFPFAVSTG
jgi:hypothetical protein